MKQKSRVLAAAFVVPVLVLSSVSAFALGFGRPTSHAVLGEPLTLSVPIRIEASEELTDECVGAEVFFGDARVSASAVSVSLQGRSATERSLRVTTSRLVNEPIVSVQVKAGCAASMTRQFVVLVDPPPVLAPAANTSVSATSPGNVSTPRAAGATPPMSMGMAALAAPVASAAEAPMAPRDTTSAVRLGASAVMALNNAHADVAPITTRVWPSRSPRGP